MDWSFKPADMADGEWISLNWQFVLPGVEDQALREVMKHEMRSYLRGSIGFYDARKAIHHFLEARGTGLDDPGKARMRDIMVNEVEEIRRVCGAKGTSDFYHQAMYQDLLDDSIAEAQAAYERRGNR